MKKSLALGYFFMLSILIYSQAPQVFNYQAILRNNSGEPEANVNVSIVIKLLRETIDGTEVFSETHSGTTNDFGLINLKIGSVNTANFASVDWSGGPYFINISVNGNDFGTSQLLSVPYAIYAASAENVNTFNFDDLEGKPSTLGGYGITDAATLAYVDAMLISTGDIERLLIAGYTLRQLLDGGRTVEELLISGVPVADIYNAGVSVSALYDEGVLVGLMLQAGIPASVLTEGGLLGTVKDTEGLEYLWVKIGEQSWMAENLRVTKYRDNTDIAYPGTNNTAWISNTTGAYAWYNNDMASYGVTYGALYNWHAVNSGKLCPTDWHIPSLEEYNQMITFLGGSSVAATKMKEPGNTHWASGTGTDESGLKVLPAGARMNTAAYLNIGLISGLWTSGSTPDLAYAIYISSSPSANTISDVKTIGYSVRCVKD